MSISLKMLVIFLGILTLLVLFIGIEIYLSKRGASTNVPIISRSPTIIGSGEELTFLVLGDSTSAGQGGDYARGIATSSAKFLSKNNQVTFYNFSVSGAKIADVLNKQWPDAKQINPDVVLVSVGANDVTGLTSLSDINTNFDKLIKNLIERNCKVNVILTGSPDMGTIPRIVEPLRSLAGWRARSVNEAIDKVITKHQIVRAPILEKTGPLFAKDSSLFAVDEFHPNDRGYGVWSPVLQKTISEAVTSQPSHCKS